MPLTSSVMGQSISNFRLYCCSKKIQMLRIKVKLLLEQLQVCIFAEIVFGVRCTLRRITDAKIRVHFTLLSVNLSHLWKSHVITDSNSYFTQSCQKNNQDFRKKDYRPG